MASKVADSDFDGQPICSICLEAPPTLKVGTTCNHVFCRNCLLNHLKRASPNKDKFPCPTCQIDCPLPPNGIDGLMAANTINAEGTTDTAATARQVTPNEPCAGGFLVLEGESDGLQCCQICKFTKNTSVDAEVLCEDCGTLYLCKDCVLVHRKTKDTEHHHLVPIRSKNSGLEGKCSAHGHWITRYCCTCSTPVCRICIHIAHGEHALKSFAEVFHEKVEEVQSKKEEQEKRLKEFVSREDTVKSLGRLSLARKGALVKSVEDEAEKYMKQITKHKEELKERIEADFKPILQLTACVDTLPLFKTKMGGLVAEAERLLTDAEPSLPELDKLSSISTRIDETSKLIEEKNGDKEDYLDSYSELQQKLPTFVPRVPDCNFGSLALATTARSGKNWGIDNCKMIFEKKLQIDDESKFIPFVTALGNDLYAIAKPSRGGEPAEAIDIYRYPGVHQLTIREHTNPAYDMAATPDGNLAVLSDGETKQACCVRLFNPTTGYLRSTKDLDVRGWLSFDINIHHQYVILSSKGGKRNVTIFSEDGSVVLTHSVQVKNCDIMNTACRIACSIRHIYVMGQRGFVIYLIEESDLSLVQVSNGDMNLCCSMVDISVGYFGRLALCYINPNNGASRIVTYILDSRVLSHRHMWESKIKARSADKEARISVRGDYIVSSQGATIRVFQYVS